MGFGLSQEQQQRVSPGLIALNQILALSSQELQEEIQREIQDNPALELDERQICPRCGTSYVGKACQRCLAEGKLSVDNRAGSKSTSDDYFADYNPGEWSNDSNGGRQGDDEEFDPITIVAAEMSLAERILMDVSTALNDDSDMSIAEFLVGNFDDRGFLTVSLEAVADAFMTAPERVEQVLKEVQQVSPPGVGARDMRECLLIQLGFLKEQKQNIEAPYVYEIVDKYLTELGEHKYTYISQQLKITNDDVNKVRDFIKKYLNPYPAEGHTREINGPGFRNGPTRTGYVVPDVIITEREGRFEVEVVESKRFYLRLNPTYQTMLLDDSSLQTDSDKEHVKKYVNRARFFISNINQRRETMKKITHYLIQTQEEFLRDGVRGLRPLTRSQLASYIGVHESTVSRATAGKYVMLPNQKVIPFSDFFTASLSIKDVIKEIIETETKAGGKSLSDLAIAQKLEERGYRVARRTITKYRAQLKILPSTMR
jgi:RNA polymerase sigma-54 factor